VDLGLTGAATGIDLQSNHITIGKGIIGGSSTGYGCLFGVAGSFAPSDCNINYTWGGLAAGLRFLNMGTYNRARIVRYSGGGSNPSIDENSITPDGTNSFTEIAY
jgi:hypothetical protein